MGLISFLERLMWMRKVDRLGPDMLSTHYKLYFPTLQRKLCEKKFAKFGENSEFRAGAYAVNCSNIYICNNVTIRPQSMLFATKKASITIEEKVLLGSGVHIYCSNHKYNDISQPIYNQGWEKEESVVLKKGCWLGANVIILPGVTVGENAVVAAGAVVTKDVEAFTVVAGIPARTIKIIE